jgi:hypothetical protein
MSKFFISCDKGPKTLWECAVPTQIQITSPGSNRYLNLAPNTAFIAANAVCPSLVYETIVAFVLKLAASAIVAAAT